MECNNQVIKPTVDETVSPLGLKNSSQIIMDVSIPFFGIIAGDSLNTAIGKIENTIKSLH